MRLPPRCSRAQEAELRDSAGKKGRLTRQLAARKRETKMNSTQNGALQAVNSAAEASPPTALPDLTATSPWTIDPTVAGSRWIALVVLCAGMLMIILDQTIVNVALPSI